MGGVRDTTMYTDFPGWLGSAVTCYTCRSAGMVFEKESISDKLHKSDDDAIKPKVPHEWGSDQVCTNTISSV